MRDYNLQLFWQMIIATMVIGGFFWFFATAGIETRSAPAATNAQQPLPGAGLRQVIRTIWSDRRTRLFFIFLSLGTVASWSHEAILEPFGADVFNLGMDVTTRFNSYWQTATVITLIIGGILWRKRPPEAQQRVTSIGLLIMALGLGVLVMAAMTGQRRLLEVGLLVFGGGFGVYTYGGVSLMAVMSPDRHAGVYLGLWTISNLLFKGLGTFLGGAMRDIFLLQANLAPGLSYGVVFLLQALGLATAAVLLSRIDILGFARDTGRHVTLVEAQIATAD
jgi:BCD family chlorophyll transporter-like MFS transporter